MRRLALAIALACALSGMARAGEIHSTGAVAPPTPGTVTAAGEIPTTGDAVAGEVPSTDGTESTTVLTIILALISSVR
jgi:hypothetical protein